MRAKSTQLSFRLYPFFILRRKLTWKEAKISIPVELFCWMIEQLVCWMFIVTSSPRYKLEYEMSVRRESKHYWRFYFSLYFFLLYLYDTTSFIFIIACGWLLQYGIFVFFQVYLCEKLSLVNEMYFSIILDRATAGPVSSVLLATSTSTFSENNIGSKKYRRSLLSPPLCSWQMWCTG